MAILPKMIFQAQNTISTWISNIKNRQVAEIDTPESLQIYNNCHTQEEIAEMLGVGQATVHRWISDIQNAHLSKMNIPDSLQLYNLWQFNGCNLTGGLENGKTA